MKLLYVLEFRGYMSIRTAKPGDSVTKPLITPLELGDGTINSPFNFEKLCNRAKIIMAFH